MGEFVGMEDWSLQAVVGGCTNYFTNTLMDNCFSPLDIQNDDDLHLFETTSTFLGNNELEQLYKPFYPIFHTTLPSETLITPSSSSSSISAPKEEHPEEKVSTPSTPTPAPKYKRRKNQQKRVVLQVTSEGVISSDMWAWRKYGQKPIKGSPYPRSYYRCSSSKGCLARKQVEQSCTDPGMFIITYTAEHSHSQPTRRNSLAGTNRNKFSTSRSPTTSGCSPSAPTPLLEVPQQPIKEEMTPDDEQEKLMVEESDDVEFVIPDMMVGDDFFAGLEDLGELASDSAFYGCYNKQFPVTFCS